MRGLRFLVVVVAVVGFVSCHDKEPGLTLINPCHLEKITQTNTRSDIKAVTTYSLNNSSAITAHTYSAQGASYAELFSELYAYDNTGRLIKTVGDGYSINYTYNGSGQITEVALVKGTLTTKTEASYNTAGQLVRKSYFDGAGVLTGYRLYSYPTTTSINTNREEYFNGQGVLQFTMDYEYDTHPSPWANTILETVAADFPCENNPLKITYTQVTGFPSVTTSQFVYEYNENGYPLKEVKTVQYTSGSDTYTTEYEYRCR